MAHWALLAVIRINSLIAQLSIPIEGRITDCTVSVCRPVDSYIIAIGLHGRPMARDACY